MKNNGIEDIAIDNSGNDSRKSGRKVILIIFIFLLIILIALFFLYNKFYKKTVTSKQLFFQSLSGANIEKIVDTNIYHSIFNRLLSENSVIKNNITFLSSNEERDFEGYDFRKFSINLDASTNVEKEKIYTELGINYSDNELINFNLLTNGEKTAIYSDNIFKKYVGMSNSNIKEKLGINYNKNLFKNIKNNNVELDEEEKNNYIKKYYEIISDTVPEDHFSVIDNYALEKNGQTVNVITYTLKLSQEELKSLLKTALVELKNDNELLEKLITNTSDYEIEVRPSENDTNNNNNTEEQFINGNEQTNEEQLNIEESIVDYQSQTPEMLVASSILPDGAEINFEEQNNEEDNNFIIDSENFNLNVDVNDFNEYINIIRLLFGNKINDSISNIEKEIEEIIDKVDNLEGNGLTVNVYVSINGTEKISAILPNDSSLDIEFNKIDEEETDISLIYLFSGQNPDFDFSDSNVKILSTSDEIQTEDGSERNNGYKIELNKTNKDAHTWFKITCNFIEDKKIYKKESISIETTGNTNSKTVTNEIILTSNAEEENKIIIENSIDFGEVNNIEDFTEQNSTFIDELDENVYKNVKNAILNQVKKVYEEKIDELKLIDSNTQKYTLKQNIDNITVTYDEAKNALVEKVSNMMWEAEEKNEEFTIDNLKDLKIDGYNVTSTVNDGVARVVVDVYSFNIDSNFTLTDSN